ncbi:tetratricopeptide repeat protein [Sphingobacterium phlebotomi]|uniref:histidine kinase n=1 Tax=Sphingobacterium phlebotomi TaxID=2605433 RepID=A0A5D4HCP2_9SPHI|nr:sensor histidine kinase [Sphingobacterium phlebotomi]TYR38438.1 tetratricopeptide repeat protein [Sphingobacterium phlebotomi]
MKRHINKDTRQIYLFLLYLTLACLPIALLGQSVDSLILAHTDKNGKVNVKDVLTEGGDSYYYNNPSSMLEVAEKVLSIAEKQKDPLERARSYQFMASCYYNIKTDYDSTFYYLQQAEKLYNTLNSKEAITAKASVFNNYGTLKQDVGEYPAAIDYYIQALKLYDETGSTEKSGHVLINISNLYALLGDYQKSEKYAREAVVLGQRSVDPFTEAGGKINLASTLISLNKYDEVIPLLEDVLAYGEKYNNTYIVFLYYLNYGRYLIEYKNDKPLAVQQFEKAYELGKLVEDEWETMRLDVNLSEAYLKNSQYPAAYNAAERGLRIAEKLQAKEYIRVASWVLAQVDVYNKDFENAYQLLNQAYIYQDTLFNEQNQRNLALLEVEYQTEKKELKIEGLEKQRKLYILLGIAGAIILLIALAFAFIRYRLAVSKRKLAEEEAQRLKQEKQLVAVQATLDGETAERTRLAKDLHDGLGSMLSLVKFNLPEVKDEAAVLETIDVSRFQKAIGMLDDSIQELRRVAHHMMPESLLRYGLKASLTDFCAAIPIADFHYFGDETRLSEKLEIMVYRCIHELVNNALKHAQANHINVQLVQEEDRISFTVQDDGIGFDQEQVIEGMGLQNVRQRVDAFQGKMNVYSSNQGTEIHVELEFSKKDEND